MASGVFGPAIEAGLLLSRDVAVDDGLLGSVGLVSNSGAADASGFVIRPLLLIWTVVTGVLMYRDAGLGPLTSGLSSDPEWKYVNLSRVFARVERSIYKVMQLAVFESNGQALWTEFHRRIEDFLFNEWVSGPPMGETPYEFEAGFQEVSGPVTEIATSEYCSGSEDALRTVRIDLLPENGRHRAGS